MLVLMSTNNSYPPAATTKAEDGREQLGQLGVRQDVTVKGLKAYIRSYTSVGISVSW
jgi:hypothetical protein